MNRFQNIDIFKGINILEMESTESCEHSFFDHAKYEHMQMNYADTIFPCFSFISGMLLKKDRVIPIRKSLQLVGLGMTFNFIPTVIEGEKFRPLGVLQRHGLSSIILNNLVSPDIRNSVLFPISLTTIWYLTSIFLADDKSNPFKNQIGTAQQKIDSPFFKNRTYEENFDPEGLLGSLMTSVTIWSGSWFIQQNFTNLQTFLVGSSFLITGISLKSLSPNYFSISKPLWTPSFVLTSNGWNILKYLFVKLSIPYLPTSIENLLSLVGRYSIEVYFIGEILLLLLKFEYRGKKSIWKFCEYKLSNVFGKGTSQTILTILFDATLIGFAALCNTYGWKLRFF
jgi:predicted acyltransferase